MTLKKLLSLIVAVLLCFSVLLICESADTYEWTPLDEMEDEIGGSSPYYNENYNRSVHSYNEAITYFRTTESGENIYSDDFSGVYIDYNGIFHICVVGKRTPVESDYLIYDRVKYSYNFLISAMDALDQLMEKYSVWSIGIDEKKNVIEVCLENHEKIPEIIAKLKQKKLYAKHSLKFYVGEHNITSW